MPEVTARTVTVRKHEKFNNATASVPNKVIDAAVGYLVGWAIESGDYPTVTLYLDHEGNMHATYVRSGGGRNYTIFGMLNVPTGAGGFFGEPNYSFHS